VLSLIALLGTVLAALGLVLPIALYVLTPPFPGQLPLTLLFMAVSLERFWFSLFTSKNANPTKVTQDWTFVAVGIAYTALMYLVILETFVVRSDWAFQRQLAALGAILLGGSIAIRYWAVHHLGKQWAIHVEGTSDAGRHLVTTGPYRLMRHPIYFAAILEVVGVPLLFNAFWALAWAAGVCIPLIVVRVRFEERNSVLVFGQAYRDYQRTTSAFGFGPRRARG
jgi:protein-S-isoprenylcysteine O-methyltransferase Ste14